MLVSEAVKTLEKDRIAGLGGSGSQDSGFSGSVCYTQVPQTTITGEIVLKQKSKKKSQHKKVKKEEKKDAKAMSKSRYNIIFIVLHLLQALK